MHQEIDLTNSIMYNAVVLKRKIDDFLVEWKNGPRKNCLLIKGARQVGKTFSVEKFGREHYTHFISINFEKTPSLKVIFDEDLDVDTLIKRITLYVPTAKFVAGQTLLFLDEIQACPQARTALKFLSIDGRFDVIASGSLLGVQSGIPSSYPTGYEDEITMYSLDFEEYLWANGVEPRLIDELRGYYLNKQKVPEAIHRKMSSLFREYIVIGGMPAVVSSFVLTNDFNEALRIQRGIIKNYLNDVAKYAPTADRTKARACFLSIPHQLAKENSKFQYSVVEKKGTARKYQGSLQWLDDAGVTCYCHNLLLPQKPLEGNVRDGFFKVYMADIGLLVAMLEEGTQSDIIDGGLGIYKGSVYENAIASVLVRNSKRLYYFAKQDQFEVDFVVRIGGDIVALEVKAGNGRSTSLKRMMKAYPQVRGIKLADANVGEVDGIVTFPLYMAMFIR